MAVANTLTYYDTATIIRLYSNGRFLLACTYQTRVEVNGSGKLSLIMIWQQYQDFTLMVGSYPILKI